MSYERVLPRDLFNEADLLKCLGRLWMLLDETRDHLAEIEQERVAAFEIDQDPSDGSIHVANLTFRIDGRIHQLRRPVNSRQKWPLWVETREGDPDFEAVRVFDDEGNLSEEMVSLIRE